MNILMSLDRFDRMGGAEMYVYELSRGLVQRGHHVYVTAPFKGGPFEQRAPQVGIYLAYPGEEPKIKYDILHAHQNTGTLWGNSRHPTIPMVQTVHSLYDRYDQPHKAARYYLCVMDAIGDRIVNEHRISEEKVLICRNPIDLSRFCDDGIPVVRKEFTILIPGTVDAHRKFMAEWLIENAKLNGWHLIFVGKTHTSQLQVKGIEKFVEYKEPIWNVEDYIKRVHAVAGLWLGRAILEAFACNKYVFAFTMDSNQPPRILGPWQDGSIKKYSVEAVAEATEKLYVSILSKG